MGWHPGYRGNKIVPWGTWSEIRREGWKWSSSLKQRSVIGLGGEGGRSWGLTLLSVLTNPLWLSLALWCRPRPTVRPMQPQNSDTSGIHVTQSMENILSFLNRYIEPWLGFGSTFLNTGSNYIFLSGVGSILLYLWYLILKPFFPPPWKSQDIKKVRMYDEPPRDAFYWYTTELNEYWISTEWVCLSETWLKWDTWERKEHCCPRAWVLAWEEYRED